MFVMTNYPLFSAWLLARYREWQDKVGRKEGSITAYAKYLGVSQPAVSTWLEGRIPDDTSLQKLAEKYGDEVYLRIGSLPPWARAPVASLTSEKQKLLLKLIADFIRSG